MRRMSDPLPVIICWWHDERSVKVRLPDGKTTWFHVKDDTVQWRGKEWTVGTSNLYPR
jgi:hypothetical protein